VILGITLSLAVSVVSRLDAQSVAVAEVYGQLADQSGAAVPGAQVKMIQTTTQATRVTTSDAGGQYVLPNLPVGPYKLEITANGFKTYTQSGLLLEVGNNASINVKLELGTVNQSVEVTAAANMLETKDTAIGQVIDRARVVELPLNGRQATDLILLSGAAVNTAGTNMTGSKYSYAAVTLSVAGGQMNGTYYLMDGGDNNEWNSNVNLPLPFPEALQEFTVETNSLPARYGLRAGATVNVVTKSGTNAWHGDLFEFLRNGDFNARNFFSVAQDTLKRNQFGATLGGPVARNKLFFFAGYQGTRNRQDPANTISFVPNAQILQGDFSTFDSGTCISGGKGRTLIDPTTAQAFPNNQIPISRFDAAALKIAKNYLPTSTDPCGKITYGIPTTGDDVQIIGRVDWVQSEKHSFFGRYLIDDYSNPGVFDGKNLLTTSQPGNLERSQSITLGDTYVFGPKTVNSFHATFTRMRNNRGPGSGLPSPADLGINIFAYAQGFPGVLSVGSMFGFGGGNSTPAHINNNTFHFADDVDMIRRRHEIAFGTNLIRTQVNVITSTFGEGVSSFNGQYTGDAMADFMLGDLSSFSQSRLNYADYRISMFGFYAQDTFHATSRLTINAGARWEPYLPATDKFHRGGVFDAAAFAAGKKSSVFINAPAGSFFYGDPGVPGTMTAGKMMNLAPRVGLVYSPHSDGRDVLRIGGGILYDSMMGFFRERETYNPPFANQITLTSVPLSNPYLGYPGGNPFPSATSKTSTFPTSGTYVTAPPYLKPTYMAQWNVSYQRQIARDWRATIAYMGNKTTHIWDADETDPAVFIPGTCGGVACSTTSNTSQRRMLYLQNAAQGQYYGSLLVFNSGANANYNALMLSVEHRLANGFTLLSNYTWSHCISNYDFGGDPTAPSYEIPFNLKANNGSCSFDIHNISNTSIVAVSPVKGLGLAGRLLGNWQVAPIVRLQSGRPITVTTGTDNSRTGISQDRPDQILPDVYNKITPTSWINRAAFAANAIGTFGNVGRSSLWGPGSFTLDTALSRRFHVRENVTLEFRGEAFNLPNHVRFSSPTASLSSPNFGQILGAGDPRILQFSLKMHF
jgi:hypothetical protein